MNFEIWTIWKLIINNTILINNTNTLDSNSNLKYRLKSSPPEDLELPLAKELQQRSTDEDYKDSCNTNSNKHRSNRPRFLSNVSY